MKKELGCEKEVDEKWELPDSHQPGHLPTHEKMW